MYLRKSRTKDRALENSLKAVLLLTLLSFCLHYLISPKQSMYRKGLAALPNVEVLSPLVTRVLAQNPGPKTLQGTNTYLVGRHPDVVLIDTGEKDCKKYTDLLHSVVTSSNLSVKSIIITHWHPDHLGGCSTVRSLLEGSINSENVSLRLNAADKTDKEIPVYKFPHEYDEKIVPEQKLHPLEDNQIFKVSADCTLKVVHTPGHTEDSISLHLLEENSLFSGDTILGGSSGDFTNYIQYRKSLTRLQELGVDKVYPGHGQVEDGSVVNKYISHRSSRENQVLAALRADKMQFSVAGLTEKVYENENLHPKLVQSAKIIVGLILEKLEVDGTAGRTADGLWYAT